MEERSLPKAMSWLLSGGFGAGAESPPKGLAQRTMQSEEMAIDFLDYEREGLG